MHFSSHLPLVHTVDPPSLLFLLLLLLLILLLNLLLIILLLLTIETQLRYPWWTCSLTEKVLCKRKEKKKKRKNQKPFPHQ